MTGPRARRAHLALLPAVLLTAACERLLTDPAPPEATVGIQLQIEGLPVGGPAEAFAKVRRVGVRFIRPDSAFRDTIFAVAPVDGRIRVPVALEVDERIEALGIVASLGLLQADLFEGQTVVRIDPGVPTTAEIPVVPVPARVAAGGPAALLPNVGDSVQLESAVLFATLDTIPGLEGTWVSEDPTTVTVTPGGLARSVQLGVTQAIVTFGTFADTIPIGSSPVDTVDVTPAAVVFDVGETTTLTGVVRDALGNGLVGRPIVWTSADAAIASVDPTGLVTANAYGVTTVIASSGGSATVVPVTVTRATNILRWTNAAGGSWSDPANWDAGVAPGPTDSVEITLDGTYTVVVDGGTSVQSLLVGAAAGRATVQMTGRTFAVPGGITTSGNGDLRLDAVNLTTPFIAHGASGDLDIRNATINGDVTAADASYFENVTLNGTYTNTAAAPVAGGTLVATTVSGVLDNQGTLAVEGSSGAASATNGPTAELFVQSVQSGLVPVFTVPGGVTSEGQLTVDATDQIVTLDLQGATLVNETIGTVTVSGANAARVFGDLDNRGALTSTLTSGGLQLTNAGGVHRNSGSITASGGAPVYFSDVAEFDNSGTIDMSGAEFGVFQSGVGAGFLNSGAVSVDGTAFFQVNGGPYVQDPAGSVTSVGAGGAGFVNGPVTLPPAVTLGTELPTGLTLAATTVGPGTITIPVGSSLTIRGGTIDADLSVQGDLSFYNGMSAAEATAQVNGQITTAPGSTILVGGENGFPMDVTVADGFVVNGALDFVGGDPGRLVVSTGTLEIETGASLDSNGPASAFVTGSVANRGTITSNNELNFTIGAGTLTNEAGGSILVAGDTILVDATGGGTFSTAGSIALSAGLGVLVDGGTIQYDGGAWTGIGGIQSNGGTVDLTVPFTLDAVLALSDASVTGAPLTLSATGRIGGEGGGTSTIANAIDNNGVIEVRNGQLELNGALTTQAGSALQIQNAYGTASRITVANGFTNFGRIELSNQSAGGSADFVVGSGFLTHEATGSLSTESGAGGGTRTLSAANLLLSGDMSVSEDLAVTVTGQFLIDPDFTPNVSGVGTTLTVVGSSDISGVVFDGVALVLDGGTLGSFDNVTFQGMDPTVEQLRINNTGAGGPFIFNNTTFLTTPTTGLYFVANDTDGGAVFEVVMAGATPATGGAFFSALGGAIISW